MDYEQIKQFSFNVVASDNGNPISLNASCSVEIEVLDVNDNSPQFTKQIYTGIIMENSPIRTKILQIEANDTDSEHFGRVSYTLRPDETGNHDYLIISDDGWILLNKDIDYEKVVSFFFIY